MAFDFRAGPVRKRVWSVGRLLVLAAALAVTYGIFFLAAMRVATRAREVQVPDLRGKSLEDARAELSDVGLVARLDEQRVSDPKIPANHVISQSPSPGTVLRRQRPVRLRVSEGQRDPMVPPVTGMPERTAEITLAAERVEIGTRAEIRTTGYDEGAVVAQDPPAANRAKAVSILVNRGEGNARFVMPDLIGTISSRAVEVMRSQGFRVSITAWVPYPGLQSGIVIRQSPQAGFQIAYGEPVTLEVSR
jgi:beta-lactam-binding protein with PASTA domain